MLDRAMTKWAFRASLGVALGIASIAACAATAPALGTEPEQVARRLDAGLPPVAESDAAPRCPYGALEDPHRGFVRWLTPDERDAGWLPPASQKEPPPREDAGPKEATPLAAGLPPSVEVGSPKFENGQVPKAEKFL